jgi:hypothetical protein
VPPAWRRPAVARTGQLAARARAGSPAAARQPEQRHCLGVVGVCRGPRRGPGSAPSRGRADREDLSARATAVRSKGYQSVAPAS